MGTIELIEFCFPFSQLLGELWGFPGSNLLHNVFKKDFFKIKKIGGALKHILLHVGEFLVEFVH